MAGTLASLSPWVMGFWTDLLGERARQPMGYVPIFGTLAGLMFVAAFSARMIAGLGEPPGVQRPRELATDGSQMHTDRERVGV